MSDVDVAAPVEVSAPTPDITGAEAKAMVEAEKAAKAGATSDASKEAAREAIRKHKLKVDGQEIEVDEDELKRGYSHQRAANKILQEGKAARKQAEEFLEMMKDPGKFFETARKLGHDPRGLAEHYLVSQLEEELLDPKERELRHTRAELEQFKSAQQREKDAFEAKRSQALTAQYAKDYENQFVAALESHDLPPDKQTISAMATYIGRAAEIGFEMSAGEAATLVRQDFERRHASIFKNVEGERLNKLLGDEIANKIRKYDVSRLKNPEQNLRTPASRSERAKTTGSKKMSYVEWRKFNGR